MAGLLKSWLLPRSFGGWALAFLLLSLVFAAFAYSVRDDLHRTYLGLQPGAQDVGPAAYAAGERPRMEKTAGGARVTLTSIYAEEGYVVVGYEVEDLTDGRRVGEHPAELQPLLGSGGDDGAPREAGAGTDVVGLTDGSGAAFRMVDNSGQMFEGPDNMVRGALQNMAAFEPDRRLEPGEEHGFRLEVPLTESSVVRPGQKMPPSQPFEGGPFVFDLEAPVRAVREVEVGQKDTAGGVTLTLDKVIDSPGRPQAVVCYEAPDDGHSWFLWGGRGPHEGGWGAGSTGSMKGVSSVGYQKLHLEGPVEGRSSFEVAEIAAGFGEGPRIRGPWTFEFDVPRP